MFCRNSTSSWHHWATSKMIKTNTEEGKTEGTRVLSRTDSASNHLLWTCWDMRKQTTSFLNYLVVSCQLFAMEHMPPLSLSSRNSQSSVEGGDNSWDWKHFRESQRGPGISPVIGTLRKRDDQHQHELRARQITGRGRQEGTEDTVMWNTQGWVRVGKILVIEAHLLEIWN